MYDGNISTTEGVDAMCPREAPVNQLVMNSLNNQTNAAMLPLTWARTTTTMPGSDHVTFQQSAILSWNGKRQAWPVPTRCGTTTLSQNVTSKQNG